jgi:hypothetical protein
MCFGSKIFCFKCNTRKPGERLMDRKTRERLIALEERQAESTA